MSTGRRRAARIARRRALVVDLACAVLLAALAMTIAAGIGIVAVAALIALLLVLAWAGIESALARLSPRSSRRTGGD